MKALWDGFAWLFLRLPVAFALPFAAVSLWWIGSGFGSIYDALAGPRQRLVASLPAGLGGFVDAVLILAVFLAGLLAAYNLSALVNWLFVAGRVKPMPFRRGKPQAAHTVASPAHNPLAGVRRIGIVLAGGGAKGAYQAGAMKAIYRFLEQHGALGKVKVVAGTSIGSWNALFWLARLVRPEEGWSGRSVHERWWRSISAKALAAPSWYVPLYRNAFLSSLPWRHAFDRIFGASEVAKALQETDIHFYLTRSNVRSGELECVTNNPAPPSIEHVTYDRLDAKGDPAKFLAGVKTGVFASMDLPPLFPYVKVGDNLFEDGGVVDNLPIVFAAVPQESCDLVFILPLNSDFEEEPNTTSMVARLMRVMDVRQGVLERNGFKLLYLYNELAALRQHVAALDKPAGGASAALEYALQRENRVINVFAVCPLKAFVQETINTRELWKKTEAGIAFDVMEQATARLLPSFQFHAQDKVRVALVSRGGSVTWDERF